MAFISSLFYLLPLNFLLLCLTLWLNFQSFFSKDLYQMNSIIFTKLKKNLKQLHILTERRFMDTSQCQWDSSLTCSINWYIMVLTINTKWFESQLWINFTKTTDNWQTTDKEHLMIHGKSRQIMKRCIFKNSKHSYL